MLNPIILSKSVDFALNIIIGILLNSRIFRHISSPSIPGIIISNNAKSIGFAFNNSNPSSAEYALCTLYPSLTRYNSTSSAISFSSSTTKIFISAIFTSNVPLYVSIAIYLYFIIIRKTCHYDSLTFFLNIKVVAHLIYYSIGWDTLLGISLFIFFPSSIASLQNCSCEFSITFPLRPTFS